MPSQSSWGADRASESGGKELEVALGFLGSLPHLDLDGDTEEGGEHPGWAESSNKSPGPHPCLPTGTRLPPKGTLRFLMPPLHLCK